MKKGDKIIITKYDYAGRVGKIEGLFQDFCGNDWFSTVIDGVPFFMKETSIAPVIPQPELEQLLYERDYQRFWVRFRTFSIGALAVLSYLAGTFFILEPSYPYYVNYLVASICIGTGIGLGLLVRIDIKNSEKLIKKIEL